MMETGLAGFLLLPIGLGLLGFVEPCSLGSSLVFIKFLEHKAVGEKLTELLAFAVVRALVIGALGAFAALAGAAFLGVQKGAWTLLGAVYAGLGMLYITGRTGFLRRSLGPRLDRLAGLRGSLGLGLLFGFNVPACAAPLIFVLLGMAATRATGGAPLAQGFASLALFGLALSAPLVLAVLFAPARRALDRLAGLSTRIPFWTGLVLLLLGAWSIHFGLSFNLEDWA